MSSTCLNKILVGRVFTRNVPDTTAYGSLVPSFAASIQYTHPPAYGFLEFLFAYVDPIAGGLPCGAGVGGFFCPIPNKLLP